LGTHMPYEICLLPSAIEDCKYWEAKKPEQLDKIKDLLQALETDPFKGIGHPEPLKYALKGAWSRHISKEHRLVYDVEGDIVYVYRCNTESQSKDCTSV